MGTRGTDDRRCRAAESPAPLFTGMACTRERPEMTDAPLTRAEAIARSELLRVHSYAVYLDLSQAGRLTPNPGFRSSTRIRFSCYRPGAASWAEVLAQDVRSVTLNGRPLEVNDVVADGRIRLPALAADNELVVDSDCDFSTSGQGLHRYVDPADQAVYLYTHLQSAHASRVFACFDQPDLKATFTLTVQVPDDWTVLANSPQALAYPGQPGDGMVIREFEQTPPISTYLVALVAGPLASWKSSCNIAATATGMEPVTGGQPEIPLGIHARRSLKKHVDPESVFAYLRDGIVFYSDAFDIPYPFPKLDVCFVPEFNFGAMENAACIVAAETFVFDRAVTRHAHQRRCEMLLHELAHQWFGNLVTPRWWNDLWLSEAFATWVSIHAQTLITEFGSAWAGFSAGKKAVAYAMDLSPAAHPVVADVPDVDAVMTAFDALTYYKGASVLRQLAARLGVNVFLDGVRRYLTAHAHGAAERADLMHALQAGTGLDMEEWSRQWLLVSGMPVVRAEFAVDTGGRFSRFAILQDPAAPQLPPPSHRLGVGVYAAEADGRLTRTTYHELEVTGLRTDVPAMVGRDAGSLILPNDGDLAYCRVTLDNRSADTIVGQVGSLADPLARTVCWGTAWEMVRSGSLAPRRFLSMVTRFLGAEAEAGVVLRLLAHAATTLRAYTDQQWARERGWPDFVTCLLDAAADPATDADRRLAFAGAIAEASLSAGQLRVVRRWFDGDAPAGLGGTDLRWRLARALVAHGAAPESLADDLARADLTVSGRRRADQLRASVPTREAKEQSWQAILDPAVPIARAAALATGFAHPAQHQVLAPFAERYARDLRLIWQRGPAEAVTGLVTRLFPSWSVSPDTVAEIGRLLASGLPPALRTPVSRGHAELVLALDLTIRDSTAYRAAEQVSQG
jgi:aminopeptidase N